MSESKFGCINPMCILEAMCRLHPNTVYSELIDDLIPTFDRVFSKLVRLNLSVLNLSITHETKVLRAIEAGQVDESVHQVSELCRSLERKYLETLSASDSFLCRPKEVQSLRLKSIKFAGFKCL